jgi:dipeptidyl aminopeptidase/acylaminoacyl peptidase
MDTLSTGVHRSSATGSATGSFVAMDYADAALKEREIVVFHPKSGARMTLFEDRTEGWLYDYDMEFAPDGDLLLFRSEQSGWNHLYLADLAGAAPDVESDLGEDGSADGSADGRADGVANGNGAERTALERTAVPVEQLTDGAFEVTWFAWSGEREFVYATNEADYGEVHLFHGVMGERSAGANSRAEDATATVTHTPLTSEEGYRYQFQLTPDKRSVVYAKTYFNQPYDLYRLDITADSRTTNEEIQLTYSVPDSFYNVDWQQEEYVRIPSRDGSTSLAVSVLYPDGYEKQNDAEDISDADDINDAENDTYPVVVFVHGAGSLQNVFKGWSNSYWREYMFHQFLTHQGYIVLEVDYRHSTGYGRKFREDVTNWMGKYETEDIVDGLDWLKEHTNGAADLSRVGIYGGSYGGFMALYAASVEPDRFHAAAALRKVTNWRNYYYANPWYTLPRLGDPDVVPDHYDRSSPLTYVSDIKAPVLLLHGLIDDNVGFQDAMQYTDELIRAGDKDFELMVYPSERHGFTEPTSWLDEYTRIYRFFEKHLNEKHLK